MAALKALSDFFKAIEKDPRINITHIGVYAALLQCWTRQDCSGPLHFYSHELIWMAKLSSRDTYFKYIRQLSEYGYIRYVRSFNRKQRSQIHLTALNTGVHKTLMKHDTD